MWGIVLLTPPAGVKDKAEEAKKVFEAIDGSAKVGYVGVSFVNA